MTSWYIRKTEILNIYVDNNRHTNTCYCMSSIYTFSVFIYVCLYVFYMLHLNIILKLYMFGWCCEGYNRMEDKSRTFSLRK